MPAPTLLPADFLHASQATEARVGIASPTNADDNSQPTAAALGPSSSAVNLSTTSTRDGEGLFAVGSSSRASSSTNHQHQQHTLAPTATAAPSPLESPSTSTTPITPQTPGRASQISFDLAQHASSSSFEQPASYSSSRRPSALYSEPPLEGGPLTMHSAAHPRRGSEPMDAVGRRMSAFRLGMRKFAGSTVDVSTLEAQPGQRRGSHLETAARGQGERKSDEGIGSQTLDSSPRSRLSFTFSRPSPSQDRARPSGLSLFSKLNKSRDQLQIATLDADDDSLDTRRRKSESGSLARQFILKTLGRSNRPAPSNPHLPPSPAMTTSEDTTDSTASEAFASSQSASQVFASAFGEPHRSDALSAQPFEENGDAANEYDRRRNSQSSAATSFFSLADTTSHHAPSRFPGLRSAASLFEQSGSHVDLQPRCNSALQRAAPDTDEGPLGERHRDSLVRPPLQLKLSGSTSEGAQGTGMPSFVQRGSPFTSPSDQDSSMTHQTRSTAPSSGHHLPEELLGSGAAQTDKSAECEQGKGKERRFSAVDGEERAVRRPSLGIDEEQHSMDRERAAKGQEEGRTAEEAGRSRSGQEAVDSGESNGNGNGSGNSQRPGRSSGLSHLPRLNSMRIVGSGLTGGAGGGSEDGGEGNENRRGWVAAGGQRDEEEHSDTDTADEGPEGYESDGTETDTGTEGSAGSHGDTSSAMPGSMPAPMASRDAAHPRQDRTRPGEIALPPAPLFTPTSTATPPIALADTANAPQAVGKDAWTRFDATSPPFDTPHFFATPKPTSQRITPTASMSQTPRGVPEPVTESSYFAIRPASARTALGGKSKGDMPPPSPSIITRSRAPSTASMRSTRSPHRELPSLPPMTPLHLRGTTPTSATVPGRSLSPSPPPSFSRHAAVPNSRPMSRPSTSRNTAEREEGFGAHRKDTVQLADMPPMPAQTQGRPGLYQQQSRSLIDLSSVAARNFREPAEPAPIVPTSAQSKESQADTAVDSDLQSPTGAITPGALRRRRSMFEVGAQPPPYAEIRKRPEGQQMIFPREEEGKESLPRYLCSVHIEGYLPRKMEFSSPGVQAKDRSWRRQYFVLHGTCLKVFKNDLSGENLLARGVWGEVEGAHVHKEPMNEDGPVAPFSTGASGKDVGHGSHVGIHAGGTGSSTSSGLGAAVEAVTALTGTIYSSSSAKPAIVKEYSLQGAESGLAADYLKRRHVVRLRVEGEQFLLQTRNDRHVVEWIEAFQAATNVSLDLERRPMPKFITLPRRRRRRRREGGTTGTTVGSTAASREAAEIIEAQRRSMAGPSGARASSSSALHPPRPLGLPGDEYPSAAFDDMLREEHDDMMRQDAADL